MVDKTACGQAQQSSEDDGKTQSDLSRPGGRRLHSQVRPKDRMEVNRWLCPKQEWLKLRSEGVRGPNKDPLLGLEMAGERSQHQGANTGGNCGYLPGHLSAQTLHWAYGGHLCPQLSPTSPHPGCGGRRG